MFRSTMAKSTVKSVESKSDIQRNLVFTHFKAKQKMEKVKSAFESIDEPSIWMRDKTAKRQNTALKAASTELKNRGLRKRQDFTVFSKAKAAK